MTEAYVRDFLTTTLIPSTGRPLADYLQSYEKEPEPLLVFEAPADQATLVDQARREAEKKLNIKTILTVNRPNAPTIEGLPGVKSIIAVASGKGGVGKSTTTINLAFALQKLGYKVGVLDADIYGPSLPTLLGLNQKPSVTPDKRLIPLEKEGLKCLSIGFMIPEETAIVWRGPMIQGALQQLLKSVEWAPLDFLMVDMPPGTGDAHLTLTQQVKVNGVVIVSTPQDLALLDARKGINMFQKVSVPIVGIIENMSHFMCPNCQHITPIFSHAGAKNEATRLNIPFLGQIPLELAIRETADKGESIFSSSISPAIKETYLSIAQNLAHLLP